MVLEMGYTRSECELQLNLAISQVENAIEFGRRDPVKSLPILMTAQPDGSIKAGGGIVIRDPMGWLCDHTV